MVPEFYILSLKVSGIKNIEKSIQLEFYKKTINKDFDPDKYRIKAIYGENGSGKTAIMLSVRLLRSLLLNKSYLLDYDTQQALVEMVNKKTHKGFIECEFYVNIPDEKIIMDYFVSFEVKDDRFYIAGEKLCYKNGNYSKNKYIDVFETENGSLKKFGSESDFEYFRNKTQNLLDKQTFLNCIEEIIDDLPEEKKQSVSFASVFLLLSFSVSLYVYIDDEDNYIDYAARQKLQLIAATQNDKVHIEHIRLINKKLLEKNNNYQIIPKLLFASYQKKIEQMFYFVRIFKPELCSIEIEKKEYDSRNYQCALKMIYDGYSLSQEFESKGIKKIINLFQFLDAAASGYIVFVDELDSNINDVYLDKIIEYFVEYGRGQLCFTSHNLSPMTILKGNRNSINFISSINTVHTWKKCGNMTPENAYKNGFVEDSPFNVDAMDFLGILGGVDE